MAIQRWFVIVVAASLFVPYISWAADVSLLEKQLAALKEQVASLQRALLSKGIHNKETVTPGDRALMPAVLMEDVRAGSLGSSVAVVQLVLAQQSPSIYPEKLVTGYYGNLTAQAVKRFERMHDLPETGAISGETKKKFNEVMQQAKIFMSTPGSYCTTSNIVGLSAKSGISHVPVCTNPLLVPGSDTSISMQVATGSPSFFYVDVYEVTGSGAKIALGVDRPVKAVAYYAPVAEHVNDASQSVEGHVFQKIHALRMDSLKKGTSYNVYVLVTDMSGNMATSSMKSFKTVADIDTSAPRILDVRARDIATSSATISWRTDEASQKKLYIAPVREFSIATANMYQSKVYTTSHAFPVYGLFSETEYAFVIESEDVKGNRYQSDIWSFKTLDNDLLPPTFLSVIAVPRAGGIAEVRVVTNEPTSVAIHYGNSDPLDIGTASYQYSATKSTMHAFFLTGLQHKSIYRLVLSAVDKVGNRATSTQYSVAAY